ncbi:heat-inducible transcription repressor HrcA [Veillonella sp. AS16]|nr:heat-inducible transcriptional repressor HrcA [Veillonella sp. AS16]ETS93750.1 heat-inducible transcription repressor HrcA [Veillonella sp. AS16]
MDERKQRILKAIIEDYVKSAEPVGSRTIAKNYNLGISPATVRNEMSDLEELGYLEQPYTSAGRIPSAKGYRLYVDSMMNRQPVPLQDAEKIEMIWKHSNGSTSELFFNMAKLLSQVSHSMSLFLAPAHDSALVKYIHVLPLGGHQAIMVVITEAGALDNELMYFGESVSPDVLQDLALQFSNALQNVSIGYITAEALGTILIHMEGPKEVLLVFSETLLRAINKRKLFYSVGATELLNQPEFKSVEKVQPLLSLVEEQNELGQLLKDDSPTPIKVKIGVENQTEALHTMSVVQADFRNQEQPIGTLAILGPTRMEYGRIIGMLSHMKHVMETMIKEQK